MLSVIYSLDSQYVQKGKFSHANNVRATLAYVKLLYDFGQQMDLSRTYLLHRIKLLEVREQDLSAEISILRGKSPLIGEISARNESNDGMANKRRAEGQENKSDQELDIILDTRIINEIDQTSAALQNISQRIADKKNALQDIEQRMDDVSTSVLSTSGLQDSSYLEEEHTDNHSSYWVEHTREYVASNRPRDGGTRNMSPNNTKNMAMSNGNKLTLPSQGTFGTPRDRKSGEPDAAGSSSDEGTVGAVSVSAPAGKMATAEINPSEFVECIMEDEPGTAQVAIPLKVTAENRKASAFSCSEIDGAIGTPISRPTKTSNRVYGISRRPK